MNEWEKIGRRMKRYLTNNVIFMFDDFSDN